MLLILPTNLNRHKVFKKISHFYFGAIIFNLVWCVLTIVFTNQWNLFFTQYVAFGSAVFIVSEKIIIRLDF